MVSCSYNSIEARRIVSSLIERLRETRVSAKDWYRGSSPTYGVFVSSSELEKAVGDLYPTVDGLSFGRINITPIREGKGYMVDETYYFGRDRKPVEGKLPQKPNNHPNQNVKDVAEAFGKKYGFTVNHKFSKGVYMSSTASRLIIENRIDELIKKIVESVVIYKNHCLKSVPLPNARNRALRK